MKKKDETEISRAALYKRVYRAFNRRIKTDEDAADAIYKKLKAEKKLICACGCKRIKRIKGKRCFICDDCKQETYFTVGTIYESAGRLRARLGALYFAQRGVIIPPSQFATIFKIVSATARKIFLENSIVLLDSIHDQMAKSDELVVVEISGHEFESIIARRSRETPAREHPYSEQEEIDRLLKETQVYDCDPEYRNGEGQTDFQIKLEDFPAEVYQLSELNLLPAQQTYLLPRQDEAEQKIFDVLSGVPRSTDDLNILTSLPSAVIASKLTMLQLDGLVVECAGGRFTKAEQEKTVARTQSNFSDSPYLENFITAFTYFVDQFFQKVSRKCLQLYIVRFWCWLDKSFRKKDALLSIALGHPPLGKRAVDQFVSAPILIFPLSQMAALNLRF